MGAKDKLARKVFRQFVNKEVSSAEKILVGQKLQGRVIRNIFKGEGNHRMIVFEDGFQELTTKDVIHSLSSAAGREQYGEIFKHASGAKKKDMLFKSMERRYRGASLQQKPLAESRLKQYKTKSQKLDNQKTESVLVSDKLPGKKARTYQAPDFYAKPLAKVTKDKSFKIYKKQPKPKPLED